MLTSWFKQSKRAGGRDLPRKTLLAPITAPPIASTRAHVVVATAVCQSPTRLEDVLYCDELLPETPRNECVHRAVVDAIVDEAASGGGRLAGQLLAVHHPADDFVPSAAVAEPGTDDVPLSDLFLDEFEKVVAPERSVAFRSRPSKGNRRQRWSARRRSRRGALFDSVLRQSSLPVLFGELASDELLHDWGYQN